MFPIYIALARCTICLAYPACSIFVHMTDDLPEDSPRYTPSSFMRKRRPYLFSDTRGGTEFALTREVLANHLDTITARNEENVFEKFARKLAAVEICPNLRQTLAPVAEGGKVDTETYEVSPEISDRWYIGQLEAASERWAFAISAKEQWKGKVRSDIKKIAETDRGYTKIYFITSRNARAKDRADIELALLKEYGVPVTILDQAWILECVFEQQARAPLAVTALGMSDELKRQTTETGPRDQVRIKELETLDAQIADTSRVPTLIAEDMLEAALAALRTTRSEVEGRFAQPAASHGRRAICSNTRSSITGRTSGSTTSTFCQSCTVMPQTWLWT